MPYSLELSNDTHAYKAVCSSISIASNLWLEIIEKELNMKPSDMVFQIAKGLAKVKLQECNEKKYMDFYDKFTKCSCGEIIENLICAFEDCPKCGKTICIKCGGNTIYKDIRDIGNRYTCGKICESCDNKCGGLHNMDCSQC